MEIWGLYQFFSRCSRWPWISSWKAEWHKAILRDAQNSESVRRSQLDPFLDSFLLFKIQEGPSHSREKIFGAGRTGERALKKAGKRFEQNRVDASEVFWAYSPTLRGSRAILRSLVPHFPADVAFFPGRCASERRRERYARQLDFDRHVWRQPRSWFPRTNLSDFSGFGRDAALESYWEGDICIFKTWHICADETRSMRTFDKNGLRSKTFKSEGNPLSHICRQLLL